MTSMRVLWGKIYEETFRQNLLPPGPFATGPGRKALQSVAAFALQINISVTGAFSPQACRRQGWAP